MAVDVPVEVLEFFVQLKYSNPRVVEWLADREAEYVARLRRERDEVTMRHVQGRAQELSELTELVQHKAAEILNRKRKAP